MTAAPAGSGQGAQRTGMIVTVLGGTGFLGRRVVRHLLDRGFRVRATARHPERVPTLFGPNEVGAEAVGADVHDEASVAAVLADADAVVNAVSLYVEHGGPETFRAVHVEAAARIARLAREAGVGCLIHVSGIGADPASPSNYIRARGEGEIAVREAFPGATLVRPSVMFGPDDYFLTTLARLLRTLPIYPLFGRGRTRLQPVHVEDVSEAIARILGCAAGSVPPLLRARRPSDIYVCGTRPQRRRRDRHPPLARSAAVRPVGGRGPSVRVRARRPTLAQPGRADATRQCRVPRAARTEGP